MWRRQQCKTGCKTCACCRNASGNVQMLLLLIFAPARFATRPIHAAVGFSNNVKGCYVQPLQQVWSCFCARFEVAQLPNSWIAIVQLVRPHARRLVHIPTSGRTKSTVIGYIVTFRRNAQVWWTQLNRQKLNKKSHNTILFVVFQVESSPLEKPVLEILSLLCKMCRWP